MHDLQPGIAPSGLFWTVRVPDEAFTKDDAAGTARIVLENQPVLESFQILSGIGVPATCSFDVTWTATGATRHLLPASNDPMDPMNFAAQFKDARATGTFTGNTVVEFGSDVPFSFTGVATTDIGWAEMGTEQNGSFLNSHRGGRGNLNP